MIWSQWAKPLQRRRMKVRASQITNDITTYVLKNKSRYPSLLGINARKITYLNFIPTARITAGESSKSETDLNRQLKYQRFRRWYIISNGSKGLYHVVTSGGRTSGGNPVCMVDPRWDKLYWMSMCIFPSLLRCGWLWVGDNLCLRWNYLCLLYP